MRCRAVLGHRPRVLPETTSRLVPVIAPSFHTVRAAVRYQPFAPSQHILRLRPASAAVQHPAALACQDITGAALEVPPFMVARLCVCEQYQDDSLDSNPLGPNAKLRCRCPLVSLQSQQSRSRAAVNWSGGLESVDTSLVVTGNSMSSSEPKEPVREN